MKLLILNLLVIMFFCLPTYGQENYNSLPSDAKQFIKEKIISVIDQIFPKIQKEESWSVDKYEYGSISIDRISDKNASNNEISVNITGTFEYTRKSFWDNSTDNVGKFTAIGVITGNYIFMKEVCNLTTRSGEPKCHQTENWANIKLRD